MRQEVLDATGGTGSIGEEHLAALPYLKGVVKETLRLYPVAPFQTRVLQQNTNLLGYEVPAGVSKHAEARNSSKTSTRLAADTA